MSLGMNAAGLKTCSFIVTGGGEPSSPQTSLGFCLAISFILICVISTRVHLNGIV